MLRARQLASGYPHLMSFSLQQSTIALRRLDAEAANRRRI